MLESRWLILIDFAEVISVLFDTMIVTRQSDTKHTLKKEGKIKNFDLDS